MHLVFIGILLAVCCLIVEVATKFNSLFRRLDRIAELLEKSKT